MAGYLYILKCTDGSYYTGSTTGLERRLAQHDAGEASKYTACRRPVIAVYACEFPSYFDAFLRERQIKNWSRKKMEALIRGDFDALVRLAKSKT